MTDWRKSSTPVCPQGHEFTPENTYLSGGTRRQCRACAADRRAREREQKRQDSGWAPTVPPVIGSTEWMGGAECRGTANPDNFFTFTGNGRVPGPVKKFCAGCPVRGECLEFALANRMSGIWAGTTDRERTKLRGREEAA